MMKNQDALRIALEEGEASPDVNDFDARKFLQELKAEQVKSQNSTREDGFREAFLASWCLCSLSGST